MKRWIFQKLFNLKLNSTTPWIQPIYPHANSFKFLYERVHNNMTYTNSYP